MIYSPVMGRFASANPSNPESWRRLGPREKPKPGEVARSKILNVKPAYVWDLSQTGGVPYPQTPMPQLLRGQAPPGLREGLVAEIEANGFAVVDVPNAGVIGGANGRTDYTTNIVSVRTDMDDSAQTKSLAHELGHVLMHHPNNPDWQRHTGIGEVEAESFALMVSAAHNMDTSDYTLPYVAGWADRVPGKTVTEVVQSTADRVCKVASQALDRLETTQAGDGRVASPDAGRAPSVSGQRAIDAAAGNDALQMTEAAAVTAQAENRLGSAQSRSLPVASQGVVPRSQARVAR